jgi:hypothetical protein
MLLSSRAKRGICFFVNRKKKADSSGNPALGITDLEFFRSLLEAGEQESTVDRERLARNVGTLFRSKQQSKFRDVGRLAEALNRLPRKHGVSLRFILPVVLTQRRLNQAGGNGVHADAFCSQFQRIGLRHHDERGLRHAVEKAVPLRAEATCIQASISGTANGFSFRPNMQTNEVRHCREYITVSIEISHYPNAVLGFPLPKRGSLGRAIYRVDSFAVLFGKTTRARK